MRISLKRFEYLLLAIIFTVLISLIPQNVKAETTTLHAFDGTTVPSGLVKSQLLDASNVNDMKPVFAPLHHDYFGSSLNNVNQLPDGTPNGLIFIGNMFTSNPANVDGAYASLWTKNGPQGVLFNNKNYKMDVDNDQHFSFWFFDGSPSYVTNPVKGGFAFVMQNDSRGDQAISLNDDSATSMKLAPSETLGVFGSDDRSPHLSGAIKNSWALEFDMDQNKSGTINDSFDMGVYQGTPSTGKVYISASYPGESSSYLPGVAANGSTYYTIPRSNVEESNLSYENHVGMWHHLDISYEHPSSGSNIAHVTYKFNDINEDGTKNTNSGPNAVDTQANPKFIEHTESLDLSKLGITSSLRTVNWGLISRNDGYNPSVNTQDDVGYVVIESASPALNIDITPQIIDVTQDNRVLTPTDNYVNDGDQLIIRNNMKYIEGQWDWSTIKTYTKIPTGMTLNTPDSGSVKYSDNTSENIQSPTVTSNNMVYTLSKAITSSNRTASMDVKMQANNTTTKDLKINGIESNFNGNYYNGHTNTQAFIIRPKKVRNLVLSSTSSANITAFSGSNISVDGLLKYADSSAFEGPGAELYMKVNDSNVDPVHVDVKKDGDNSIDISDEISAELTKELNSGVLNTNDTGNTFELYARDSFGNKSNVLKFNIKISDKSVTLGLSNDNYEFNDIQSFYKGLIHRKGTWIVDVNAVDSAWTLSATASSLVTKDAAGQTSTFDGEMIYKSGTSIKELNSPVEIDSAEKETGSTLTRIGEEWPLDAGILLDSNGGAQVSGKYMGTISWDLVQGP